jgi:hypothetical protein
MADDDYMLHEARTQADRAAAQNAGVQSGVADLGRRAPGPPAARAESDRAREDMVMKAVEHGNDAYADMMGRLASKGSAGVRLAVRGATRTVPGLVLTAADIAAAKDKKRAAFVEGAGFLGGVAGGVAGAGGGPVGSFVGGAIGSEGAEWAAGKVYDHREDIARYVDDVSEDVGRAGLRMMDATFGRGLYPGLRSPAGSY